MPFSIDPLFILAAAAMGLGLSLMTYRLFAMQNEWPMGELHAQKPLVPILIGLFAVAIGLLFAAARGAEYGGWWIVLAGFLVAIFWTGFMRVAGQISLFLAPLITAFLLVAWIGVRPPSDIVYIPGFTPSSLTSSEPLPLSPRRPTSVID